MSLADRFEAVAAWAIARAGGLVPLCYFCSLPVPGEPMVVGWFVLPGDGRLLVHQHRSCHERREVSCCRS